MSGSMLPQVRRIFRNLCDSTNFYTEDFSCDQEWESSILAGNCLDAVKLVLRMSKLNLTLDKSSKYYLAMTETGDHIDILVKYRGNFISLLTALSNSLDPHKYPLRSDLFLFCPLKQRYYDNDNVPLKINADFWSYLFSGDFMNDSYNNKDPDYTLLLPPFRYKIEEVESFNPKCNGCEVNTDTDLFDSELKDMAHFISKKQKYFKDINSITAILLNISSNERGCRQFFKKLKSVQSNEMSKFDVFRTSCMLTFRDILTPHLSSEIDKILKIASKMSISSLKESLSKKSIKHSLYKKILMVKMCTNFNYNPFVSKNVKLVEAEESVLNFMTSKNQGVYVKRELKMHDIENDKRWYQTKLTVSNHITDLLTYSVVTKVKEIWSLKRLDLEAKNSDELYEYYRNREIKLRGKKKRNKNCRILSKAFIFKHLNDYKNLHWKDRKVVKSFSQLLVSGKISHDNLFYLNQVISTKRNVEEMVLKSVNGNKYIPSKEMKDLKSEILKKIRSKVVLRKSSGFKVPVHKEEKINFTGPNRGETNKNIRVFSQHTKSILTRKVENYKIRNFLSYYSEANFNSFIKKIKITESDAEGLRKMLSLFVEEEVRF